MMGDKERGRLFSIQMDGSDNSVPFIIKKDKLLIGRGDSCEIRIYVDGVLPEHCVITFNDEGRGFVEPMNKSCLTFLNRELIERQVSLEHNDVITIVKRSFRFFYPSSSKFYVALQPVTNSEDMIVEDYLDFDPEEVFCRRGREMQEKRVTFGPRLSPEEFDKNMPPASPLRRGSLPADKLKTKVQDTQKSHFKRALFNSKPVTSNSNTPVEGDLPRSSVVLHKLRCSGSVDIQNLTDQSEKVTTNSRPLFSEVLKKSTKAPQKNVAVNKTLQRYSPKRLAKKAMKLQNSKKVFYKSSGRPVHPRVLAVGSTGHANSPETIVIYKKRMTPSRNTVSSVKKRKSLRLMQGSLNSRKSISGRKKEGNAENNSSTPVKEPVFTQHGSHHNSFDKVVTPETQNYASLDEAHDNSTPKRKSVRPQNKRDSTPSREKDTNDKHSSTSPLAVAIDSVAQLDENNIDKSLKDIHNAVQALACHSSVSSALNNEPSSSDMCMNAVKKLALTISMVNAFHMYRRIIDDVSSYPLCFPSTSFDSNKCVQRSGAHPNEDPLDIGRVSWFQDIMRNFFSSSICNDVYEGGRKCMLRSCTNDVCPEVTSICSEENRKSKYTSKDKVPLRAIDSACKNPKCKSVCSHHEDVTVFYESDEMQVADNSVSMSESGICSNHTPVRTSCSENSHRESIFENDTLLNSTETSSSSLSQIKHCSHHLVDAQSSGNQELSTSKNTNLRKSRKSLNKSSENVPEKAEAFNQSKRRLSLQLKKSPHSSLKGRRVSSKLAENSAALVIDQYVKLKTRKSVAADSKPKKVALTAKKHGITASKKIKEQKRNQKHRLSVLKKVNFKTKSPARHEAPKQNNKSPRILLKNNENTEKIRVSQKLLQQAKSRASTSQSVSPSTKILSPKVLTPKQDIKSPRILLKNKESAEKIRVSQKLLQQAKSRASTSPSVPISPSSTTILSPKVLRKRVEKRKSVVFKSLGSRNKRSDLIKTKKRKSLVANTSPKRLSKNCKTRRGNKTSEIEGMDVDNHTKIETATKLRSTEKDLEIITETTYKEQKDDTESTPVVKSRKTKEKKKTTKSSIDKRQRNTKTVDNSEDKNVNALENKKDDHTTEKIVSVGKRMKKSKKCFTRISLSPIKETRNLRKRECVKTSQVQKNDKNSQESEKAHEVSLSHEKDMETKVQTAGMAPVKSSKINNQRGRKNLSRKNDNQGEQSEPKSKSEIDKEQISDKAESPKKSFRTKRKKNNSKSSLENENKDLKDESQVETGKQADTVLKEITKNATARSLRSKNSKAQSTSTETPEVVVEKSQKPDKRRKEFRAQKVSAVINTEEKPEANGNNDNENQSQRTTRKRKNVNESRHEISPKKAIENSKAIRRKRKNEVALLDATNEKDSIEVILIKDTTTVKDSQNKRRKVKTGAENIPGDTPKRGRPKRNANVNTEKKNNQTKASRTLRSRK